MSKKKHRAKIVTPTQEELRQYGGREAAEAPGARPPPPSEESPPQEAAVPAADELAGLKDKLLRARAELANVQRRAANEKDEALRYAIAAFARDLLPVVDDFERILEAAGSGGDPGGILAGAKLVYENLLKVLKNHHLERIEAEGQPFDPTWHEAVMQQPSPDHPPRTVLREVQKGYRLHDRLLRAAKVVVSGEPVERPGDREAEHSSEQTDHSPGDCRESATEGS